MKRLLILTSIMMCLALPARGAELPLTSSTVVRFATVEEGREVLGASDAFTRAMSPWERWARLGGPGRYVSETDFLKAQADGVRPWTKAEVTSVTRVWQEIKPRLAKLELPLPPVILMVKCEATTGSRAVPYSRGNAIVIPPDHFIVRRPNDSREADSRRTEIINALGGGLFYIMMRHDPALRRVFQKMIGYEACEPIELPEPFKSRSLTLPEYPVCDSMTTVTEDEEQIPVAPVSLLATRIGSRAASSSKGVITTTTINGKTYTGNFTCDLFPQLHRKVDEDYQSVLVELEPAGKGWRVKLLHGGPVQHYPMKPIFGIAPNMIVLPPEKILARDFTLLVADPLRPARDIYASTRAIDRRTSEALARGTIIDAVSGATRMTLEDNFDDIRKASAWFNRMSRMRAALAR